MSKNNEYNEQIIRVTKQMCETFIAKVESGKARSVKTYADAKEVLEMINLITTTNLNIYHIENGEIEAIIARTSIEALQIYCTTTGDKIQDLDPTDVITEVPESEWDTLKVSFPDDSNEKPKTYREMMKGVTEAHYGWSSVY